MITTECWADIYLVLRDENTFDSFHGKFNNVLIPQPGDIVKGGKNTYEEKTFGFGLVIACCPNLQKAAILWSRDPHPQQLNVVIKKLKTQIDYNLEESKKTSIDWNSHHDPFTVKGLW